MPKPKRKKKLSIKTSKDASFDELESLLLGDESLLLDEDNATQTKCRKRSGQIDDDELLESPVVIKKSKKRRKTRASTASNQTELTEPDRSHRASAATASQSTQSTASTASNQSTSTASTVSNQSSTNKPSDSTDKTLNTKQITQSSTDPLSETAQEITTGTTAEETTTGIIAEETTGIIAEAIALAGTTGEVIHLGETTAEATSFARTTVEATHFVRTTAEAIPLAETTVEATPFTRTTAEVIHLAENTAEATPFARTTAEATALAETTAEATPFARTTVEVIQLGESTVEAIPLGETTAEAIPLPGTTVEATPLGDSTAALISFGETTAGATHLGETTAEGMAAEETTTVEGATVQGATIQGSTEQFDTIECSNIAISELEQSVENSDHIMQNSQPITSQNTGHMTFPSQSQHSSEDIRDETNPRQYTSYVSHSQPITAHNTGLMSHDNQSQQSHRDKVKSSEEAEIDIYSDLSTNQSPPLIPGEISPPISDLGKNNDKAVQDITFDEIFKMSDNHVTRHVMEPLVQRTGQGVQRIQRYPSEREEEDLDYEEDASAHRIETIHCLDAQPQMKIGVLVSQPLSGHCANPDTLVYKPGHCTDTQSTTAELSGKAPPRIIPPMLLPPMLPLPPITVQNTGHMISLQPITAQNSTHMTSLHQTRPDVLHFPPPHYQPMNVPALPRNNSKRKIYINPKFKTQVILSNLEKDGVLKGGVATVHINSRHATTTTSPDKQRTSSVPEYVPSPIRKSLDEPTTTLIVTELSACTTRNRLKEMFASIGTLKEVQTYPQERRAVVTFAHAKDAVVCRRKFHRSFIDGTYMSVNFAI